MNTRPKGVWTYKSPVNAFAEEAKKRQRQRQELLAAARAKRAERPVPNYLCYPEAFKNYDPKTQQWHGGRLPKCRVCGCTLQPTENHKCEGFKPMFAEHDEAWHERMEARREAILEAKRNGTFYDEDEDDLSGYEDWVDEDESYEEDDGDPMWE